MLNTWYSKEIGDAMMAAEPSAEIEAAFEKIYIAAGKPADMAVFIRHESDGRLHCEAVVYFPPALSNFAESLQAEPCEKPLRAELGLLAGDKSAWSIFFPQGPD